MSHVPGQCSNCGAMPGEFHPTWCPTNRKQDAGNERETPTSVGAARDRRSESLDAVPPAAPQPATDCPTRNLKGYCHCCDGAAPHTPAEPVADLERLLDQAIDVIDGHRKDPCFASRAREFLTKLRAHRFAARSPHSAGPATASPSGSGSGQSGEGGVVALDGAPATQCPKLGGGS